MAQNIEFKVGLFIALTTVLILGSFGYIAYKKGVLSKVYTYNLVSKTGENLAEGMPVVFWGFTIGRVSGLELTDKGVVIQIKVPERHNRVIRANSRFVLDKPLIGASRLIVTTYNMNDPPLSPETMPEIGVSNDINELVKQVQPIAVKVDKIAAHVEQITSNLADPQGEMRRIMKAVEQVTENLAHPRGEMRRIMKDMEQVTKGLAEAQGDLRRILRDVETVVGKFVMKESLLEMAVGSKESVQSAEDILSNVRAITAQVDGIVKKVDAPDGLLKKVDTLAGKADDELYGRDGVLPLTRDVLRDLLAKLVKLDATVDNINSISGEAADSAKDLQALRTEVDAAVAAVREAAENLDRMIPFQAEPEIRLP